jgi:hypothetical protein
LKEREIAMKKANRKETTMKALKFETADEAMQHTAAAGGEPILFRGEYLVVSQKDADRLAAAGVEFAYLVESDDYRIFTIPVND